VAWHLLLRREAQASSGDVQLDRVTAGALQGLASVSVRLVANRLPLHRRLRLFSIVGQLPSRCDVSTEPTAEKLSKLPTIVSEMQATGVDSALVSTAEHLARSERNVCDLLVLWYEIVDARLEILADLREAIDDYQGAPTGPLTLRSTD
jgi:hypothetical protein